MVDNISFFFFHVLTYKFVLLKRLEKLSAPSSLPILNLFLLFCIIIYSIMNLSVVLLFTILCLSYYCCSWTVLCISIWWWFCYQTGPTVYRSRTVFEDVTPEVVRDYFWDDEFRPKWDPMLVYFKILEECPHTGTMIVQWIKKVGISKDLQTCIMSWFHNTTL